MSLALRVYVDDTADAIVSRVRRPGATGGRSTLATLSTGLSGVGSPHVAVGEDNEAFAAFTADNDESNPLAGGGEQGGSGAVPTATRTAKPTRKAVTGCKKAGKKLANTKKQVKKAKKRSKRAKRAGEACG